MKLVKSQTSYLVEPSTSNEAAALDAIVGRSVSVSSSNYSRARKRPLTRLNRLAGSPLGTAVIAHTDKFFNGGLDEMVGVADSLMYDRNLERAIAEANLKKRLSAQAHPLAHSAGGFTGEMARTLTVPPLGRAAGRLSPGQDFAGGAIGGALENNENRMAGAAEGGIINTIGALGGDRIGRATGLDAAQDIPKNEYGVQLLRNLGEEGRDFLLNKGLETMWEASQLSSPAEANPVGPTAIEQMQQYLADVQNGEPVFRQRPKYDEELGCR